MATLQDRLDAMSVQGELYEVVDESEKKIRCYACGHRCLIKNGGRGVCKVRYNEDGVLRVPSGYVGALQVDPIEKKPFNHVDPGAIALSFGMLGCDLHCSYCFAPETPIVTERGVLPIADLFLTGECVPQPDGAEVAFPTDLLTISQSGQFRRVNKVFKHPYRGSLSVIKPYYLPEIRCTPDHRVFATDDPARPPELIEAQNLTSRHFLAMPRHYSFSSPQVVDVQAVLQTFAHSFQTPHKLQQEEVDFILAATAAGMSSREIGEKLGKNPSYIRHVRSKIGRGVWGESKTAKLQVNGDWIRFSKEHRPGIPARIKLNEGFARLLGLYCAEGSVLTLANCPGSYVLVFAYGLHEENLAQETCDLLRTIFGVEARKVHRQTTLGVTVNKSSVAMVFKGLCGTGSVAKHVPRQLFNAPRPVVTAFLDAYLQGDGHQTDAGKVNATTKSRDLAHDVAWLGLKTDHLISIYANKVPEQRTIMGRTVKQSPVQYSIVWYEPHSTIERKCVVTDDYYLIPIRSLDQMDYDGSVYNLEVEEEHNYLANFLLVSNCQNWDISQHGRDDNAGRDPLVVSPAELVRLAKSRGAKAVASTYNEPLITSEWAVTVFKEVKQAGLRALYISNGNGTPEVIHYLRPWLDAYKIDLKTMQDKQYRHLGGVLQNILDTIKLVKESGLWLEVVTLVIPGFNDSNDELWDAARFLASVSPDIPWHVTAFHPDYKMIDPPRTTVDTLTRAAEIGAEAGLRYVYAGNIPGMVGEWEHTYCPTCHDTLIRRYGFHVIENRLLATHGACPKCGTQIPGVWS